MPDRPTAKLPWLLVIASVLLVALNLYVLFVGYVPAKQRAAGLEAELQTKLAQLDQRHALRERQNAAERDSLMRRLEDLERQLRAARR